MQNELKVGDIVVATKRFRDCLTRKVWKVPPSSDTFIVTLANHAFVELSYLDGSPVLDVFGEDHTEHWNNGSEWVELHPFLSAVSEANNGL